MEAVTIWIPVYVMSAGIKIVTALASLITALVLPFKVPHVLEIVREARSSREHELQLEAATEELTATQTALRKNNEELERGVEQRTSELTAANKILKQEALERQRVEAHLAEFSAIVESSEDAIISKKLDGTIKTWNKGAERLYGYTSAEMVGNSVFALFPKASANAEAEIFDRLRRGERIEHYETVRRKKNGEEIDVSLAISPVKNFSGDVVGGSAIARDISLWKRTQETLRDQAKVLDLAQVLVRDLDDKILLWNRGALMLYGYSVEEATGQNSHTLLKTKFPEPLTQIKAKFLETGSWEGELVHTRRDGTQIIVASTWVLQYDENEKPKRILEANTDITARIRAEEARKNSEKQYRDLFDSNPMPMWVFDRGTLRFLAVNDAAIAHYGYSRQEFLGKTILEIRRPEDSELVRDAVQQNTGGLSRPENWKHVKKDGSVIDVEITTHDVSLQGKTAELVLANDVTEQKKGEEKLRQSEEKFAKAFKASPFPMAISTVAGKYVEINDAFLRILGYSRDEIVGHSVRELNIWIDPNERKTLVERMEKTGQARLSEVQFKIKSGEMRVFEYSAELITLDGEACILAIANDITDARRLEEQFRQAQKMEAVGRLAGGVAHDFNNLLGVVIGYCDISQDHLDPSHLVSKHLEQIRKSADRATSLTRQLLAFSRQQVLQPRILDLNAVVYNISKMLYRMIGEDVKLRFSPTVPLGSVKADLGQLEQVLMNLVINSRDAMPQGGQIFLETANVTVDENYVRQHSGVAIGEYVMLSVSDTGCGMDQKTKARIFEPFFTTKASGEGTGLGLSVVYGIVKQSGGNIWVYSEVDKGTTFKLYLPRVQQQADSLIEPRTTPIEITGTETILLVEDDEMLRDLTKNILQAAGFKVLDAGNGARGIEIVKTYLGDIHLLVTDVVMPGMSGGDLAKELKHLRPSIALLYISGYTGELIAHHGVLDIKTRLLQKPYGKNALLTSVRAALEDSPVGSAGEDPSEH